MTKLFVKLSLISIKRSPLFESKLILKIFLFIGASYLVLNFLFIGYFLDKIFSSINPQNSSIDTFGRIFLFIPVADILLKHFMKSINYINIVPLLTLPIKKKKMFNFMFLRELLSKWNFTWIIILTPFFIKTIDPVFGYQRTLFMIFLVFLVSNIVSFFIRFIDVISVYKSFLFSIVPLIVSVFFGLLGYLIAVSPNIIIDFSLLLSMPSLYLLAIICSGFICLYIVYLQYFKTELYTIQNGKRKPKLFKASGSFDWTKKWGIKGEILKMCVKEISRSQLKQVFFTSVLFLLIPCLNTSREFKFMNQSCYSIAPLIMLSMLFCEFTFSAESTFFDKLSTLPKNIVFQILKTKYLIYNFLAVLFTAFLIIITINKIPIQNWISFCLFDTGIFSFLIFQNAVYNQHRLNMLESFRKVSSFNLHSFIIIGLMMLVFGAILLISCVFSDHQ